MKNVLHVHMKNTLCSSFSKYVYNHKNTLCSSFSKYVYNHKNLQLKFQRYLCQSHTQATLRTYVCWHSEEIVTFYV